MKKGIGVSKGYAIGKAFVKEDICISISDDLTDDVEFEKNNLKKTVELSKKQLTEIKDRTEKSMGKDKADVFGSHLMFLSDVEFIGKMENEIETKKYNCGKAIQSVVQNYIATFNALEDEYMKERAADVKDVGQRLLRNLFGKDQSFEVTENNTIVVAHDLTPSDTASLDKSKVSAFLTDIGGRTSHSAIMARTLEIPAVVGLKDITSSVKNGDTLIVDGVLGNVIINPSDSQIKEYKLKISEYEDELKKLKVLVNMETVSKSGKKVKVCANIGKPQDVENALENGAEGIGLFRSEFLYMDRDSMPTEEEQFNAYKTVVSKMKGKTVVIRTLDVGGDKQLPYLNIPKEMNPFLGYRAIRLCLGRKDIFKTQLRALLRASVFGNLKIMFPMISSADEVIEAKKVVKECMDELKSENAAFNEKIKIGIMVEIPAAALDAEHISKYVDFFSIGTNDLIQYTLAVDRVNEKVSYLYNPMHPSVLRLIKMTIDAAHKAGILCGMCGEMASDENAIPKLLEFGLDEFSMSASSILKAKQIIMNK